MTFNVKLMEERMEALAEGEATGRAKEKAESEARLAEEKAKSEAKLAENYASLVKDGILTLSDAVNRSELSEDKIRKYLEPEN